MTEETKQLIFLAAAIATIISILGSILFSYIKWGRNLVKKIRSYFKRRKLQIPNETIKVVTPGRSSYWNTGKIGNEPAMQIDGHLYVTNITNKDVHILSVEIVSPRKARKKCVQNTVMTRNSRSNIYGNYKLVPNLVSEASINFWVQPIIINEEKDLKLTIVLIDQFGNRHKVKNLLFKNRNKKKIVGSEPPEIQKESIYKIENEIEKQIASILKFEIEKYKECGRRVGGLGSVRLKNSNSPGVGTEWRKADSPVNKSINDEPKKDYIISDNAKALINLYNKLENSDDRSTFVSSLLNRLSRKKEYASVGYLIFLVLFRIGKLETTFDVSKKNLYKDSGYGFSDSLKILDGLLRFEHSSFSTELLEKIEAFIEGVDEYPFRIPERLSAISAFRLNNEHTDN